MKIKLKSIKGIAMLIAAWHVFQWNSLLNYINWRLAILKAKFYHKLYRRQFFIIAKNKHKLVVVDYHFVNRYNDLRKKLKLADKKQFDQFKMKKITMNTLQNKCYYKTSLR
jgi:hypothetical protein